MTARKESFRPLILGSLFSGVGGLDEGARRTGRIKTAFQVELIESRRANLQKYHRNAVQHDDIRTFDGTPWAGKIDILAGGFPCQDISAGGPKTGINGSRSRLWGEFARIIAEVRPGYVLIENSPRLLTSGFEQVLWDLSDIGYDAEWDCISAAAFGMPHERKRVFIIAYPHEKRRPQTLQNHLNNGTQIFLPVEAVGPAMDDERAAFLRFSERMGYPAVRRVDDGFPGRLHVIDRLAGVGDAVSPVVAEYLFHCIIFDHDSNEF